MHDLGSLGGTESDGGAINASGQVSGSSLTTGDAAYHAFLWKPVDAERHQRHDARPLNARRNREFWRHHQCQRSGGRLFLHDRRRGLPRLSVDANDAERHQRHDAGPDNAGWTQQLQLQRRRRRSGGRRVRSSNNLRSHPRISVHERQRHGGSQYADRSALRLGVIGRQPTSTMPGRSLDRG